VKTLQHLLEMAKRASPDQFYGFGKAMYGAEKVKALTWPEIKAIADKHDVLIPAYLRSQKVGRGRFNIVPQDHADTKAPAKTEPKSDDIEVINSSTARGMIKVPVSMVGGVPDYKHIQDFLTAAQMTSGGMETQTSTTDGYKHVVLYSKVNSAESLKKALHAAQGKVDVEAIKKRHKDAADKAAAKKAAAGPEDELKAALLDLKSELRNAHRNSQYCTWDPIEKSHSGNGMEFGVRYWGDWKVPDDEEDDGDYDWKVLTDRTRTEIKRVLDAVRKRHPKIKLDYSTGEKEWLYFHAE
jgi:hypothetical protein